jgi:hypothetical protein
MAASWPGRLVRGVLGSRHFWTVGGVAVLGLFGVWQLWPSPRQLVEARAERLGGLVINETEEQGRPVVSVVLISRPVEDRDLERLEAWGGFQRLFLDGCPLKDEALARVGRMTRLEYLALGNCPITDRGLKHLRGLSNLEGLNLQGCPVTDRGLEELKLLPRLRRVFLQFTSVTPGGANQLLRERPGLTVWMGRSRAGRPLEPSRRGG